LRKFVWRQSSRNTYTVKLCLSFVHDDEYDNLHHLRGAFHLNSTGVPQKGQLDTMTDNMGKEFNGNNSIKNNV